eukprot:COSAG02_NODE_4112_length_5763_cov_3.743997_4_plen_42_part_00
MITMEVFTLVSDLATLQQMVGRQPQHSHRSHKVVLLYIGET